MSDCRQSIRNRRKQLSSASVANASQKIADQIIVLPAFLNSTHIAYYFSDENEVDPTPIIVCARALNKKLYLPVLLEKDNLQFYHVNEHTEFQKNKFGIAEPIVSTLPTPVEQFDMMLIPLVAFDVHCHRLGRGAGYYDRYLQAATHPILIGLAYEFQKVETIIPESWDVPMHYVVTEQKIYAAKQDDAVISDKH